MVMSPPTAMYMCYKGKYRVVKGGLCQHFKMGCGFLRVLALVTTFFASFPSAPAVRMSLSFNHPVPIPIKLTSPHMEALLSAPSVFWSPCCPPWTFFFAACQSPQSLAAQVRPLPRGTWVCSRWSPRVEASAAAWACKDWMLFGMLDANRDLIIHLITAVACSYYCDQQDWKEFSTDPLLREATCHWLRWWSPDHHLHFLTWAAFQNVFKIHDREIQLVYLSLCSWIQGWLSVDYQRHYTSVNL